MANTTKYDNNNNNNNNNHDNNNLYPAFISCSIFILNFKTAVIE